MTMPSDDKTLQDIRSPEKLAEFFSAERIRIQDLSPTELRERRIKFQNYDFEVKSYITAIDAKEREDRAKMSVERKSWLVGTGNDPLVTDAIVAVKERKSRMSKIDKLRQDILGMPGMTKELADTMIRDVEKNLTAEDEKDIKFVKTSNQPAVIETSELCRIARHSECTGSFHTNGTSYACNCDCHRPVDKSTHHVVKSTDSQDKPFDPSSLFGK